MAGLASWVQMWIRYTCYMCLRISIGCQMLVSKTTYCLSWLSWRSRDIRGWHCIAVQSDKKVHFLQTACIFNSKMLSSILARCGIADCIHLSPTCGICNIAVYAMDQNFLNNCNGICTLWWDHKMSLRRILTAEQEPGDSSLICQHGLSECLLSRDDSLFWPLLSQCQPTRSLSCITL